MVGDTTESSTLLAKVGRIIVIHDDGITDCAETNVEHNNKQIERYLIILYYNRKKRLTIVSL